MSQPPSDDRPAASSMDPWERRERERERYSRSASSSRKSSSSKGEHVFDAESYVAVGLVGSIGFLLLGDIPRLHEVPRSLLIVAGSIIPLLLFAFARFHVEDLKTALRRGPNPWILGLLAWTIVEFFVSPFRHADGFGIVGSELVRVFSGAVIYLVAAYGLRSPREISSTCVGLIGLSVLIALVEFYEIGSSQRELTHTVRLNTIFGSHEGLGTLLMLVLPLPLAFALSSETEEKRRLAALAASLALGLGLLLSRTRSAWIGMTVAFLLLLLFHYWINNKSRSKTRTGSSVLRGRNTIVSFLTSPVTLLVLALVGALVFGGASTFIKNRASIKTAIADSGSRLTLWKAGARMTAERPLTGWGLGSFLILQGRWSHIGDDVAAIVTHGADENNNAHNYYVQWAAETGATGLVLYVAVISASLMASIRGIWNLRGTGPASASKAGGIPPFQRTLLIGCTAAFGGGCVDAIASPGYTFYSLYGILWILMGIGVACLRPVTKQSADKETVPALPALLATPPVAWGLPPLVGGAAALLIIAVGHQQTQIGKSLPRGTFQVRLERQESGAILPGERLIWKAAYHDAQGNILDTYPGTLWEFSTSDALALEQMKRSLAFSRFNLSGRYSSVLSVAAPSATLQPIVVHATYYDVYSRRYDAWSSVAVTHSANPPISSKPKK